MRLGAFTRGAAAGDGFDDGLLTLAGAEFRAGAGAALRAELFDRDAGGGALTLPRDPPPDEAPRPEPDDAAAFPPPLPPFSAAFNTNGEKDKDAHAIEHTSHRDNNLRFAMETSVSGTPAGELSPAHVRTFSLYKTRMGLSIPENPPESLKLSSDRLPPWTVTLP